MKTQFTIEDLEKKKKAGLIRDFTPIGTEKKRKSKFNNEIIEIDGYKFRSKKEAARYLELRQWQYLGIITELRLQVSYELNPGGTHSLKYIADFVYNDKRKQETIVEDCKGYRTVLYKKKKRLMKEVYGIDVYET